MNDLRLFHVEDDRKFYLVEVGKPFTVKPAEALRITDQHHAAEVVRAFRAYLAKIRVKTISMNVEPFEDE